ncbi:hypothetical protein [Pontibacter sp. H249]
MKSRNRNLSTDVPYVPLILTNAPAKFNYTSVLGQVDIYPTL